MSDPTVNRLYELLPRIIRVRDVTHGDGALLALLNVLDRARHDLDDLTRKLYDDLFIETCDDEQVDHLGSLIDAAPGATRAEVANTLAYRRRSGLLSTIEQLAGDITGCVVVAAEVRQEQDDPGRPDIELAVHVTDSYPITDSPARRIKQGCFTFHPLGVDTPLFTDPTVAGRFDRFVPAALQRDSDVSDVIRHITIVADGLAVPRAADADGGSEVQIDLVDLGRWRRPRSPKRVNLDPLRGRITFPSLREPEDVRVQYVYGARVDVGGGPYPRRPVEVDGPVVRLSAVGASTEATPSILTRIVDRVATAPRTAAAVRIGDNSRYTLNAPETAEPALRLAAGQTVAIGAEDGFRPSLIGDLEVIGPERGVARFVLDGVLLEGTITVRHNVQLTIRHCTVLPTGPRGQVHRPAIALAGPATEPEVRVAPSITPGPEVRVVSSIVGPVRVDSPAGSLTLVDSIIDAPSSAALAGPGDGDAPPAVKVRIERSTVLGVVRCADLEIIDSLVPDTATGAFPVDPDDQPIAHYGHAHFGTPEWSGVLDVERCGEIVAQPGVWLANPKLAGLARLRRVIDHAPLGTRISVRLV